MLYRLRQFAFLHGCEIFEPEEGTQLINAHLHLSKSCILKKCWIVVGSSENVGRSSSGQGDPFV